MKWLILSISSLCLILSCHNAVENKNNTPRDEVTDTPYFDPRYEYVQLTPDSLLTPEDLLLIEKLKVLHKYLRAEGNEVVLGLTKEEFLAMGIPEQYYILVQKDLININKMFQENKATNIDSILKTSAKNQILE